MEAADCAFLALISLVSSAWYVARLGFYSDDWGLFAAFALSPNRSVAGLVSASFMDRPAQGVYSILLYRIFGLRPLGYHLTNAMVVACTSVLLYLVVRRLQPSRAVAFGVALVYVVLPNYSTDRFWFAAFAAPLSIVFYLLSLLADIDAGTRRGLAYALRRLGAIAALVISVLLYEAALPFFFVNPLLVRAFRKRGPFWGNWVVLLALGIYKLKTSPRLHAPRGVPALIQSIMAGLLRPGFKDGDYGLNLRAAFNVNFGDYFLRLPATVWSLHQHHPLGWLPLTSVAFGTLVFLYARSMRVDFTGRHSAALALLGVALFLLGYSTFLTNKAIQITPAGIGNRTSIAASLGVAFAVIGVLGWVTRAFPAGRAQATAFGGLVGTYAAAGFFVISSLSSFWIEAYGIGQAVVNDVEAHVAPLPPQTTLLLGGICSYHGPAIIFEADWDLSGLLRLHSGDRTISADILRPGLYSLTDSGVATILYEGEDDYDYSPNLLLYDFGLKKALPLTDKAAALKAFREGRLDATCPPGGEGVGSRVF